MSVPRLRVHQVNSAPTREDRDYVLYWMIANRRIGWNFALQHAVDLAAELDKPMVVLEALRCDYPFASDRLHRFILQGMADNARRLERTSVTYFPFVERQLGQGNGLLAAMARRACVVVTDLFPGFFLPHMIETAARRLDTRLEQVDSCGLLPLAAADAAFPLAHSFRRYLQKNLGPHLRAFPLDDPLASTRLRPLAGLPREVTDGYLRASDELLAAGPLALSKLPIDHGVGAVALAGGAVAGQRALDKFLSDGLERYDQDRNHPDLDGSSGLSPWLHFGHVSAHQVVRRVLDQDGWDETKLAPKATGSRAGWWGVSAPAEAYLDQVVTWRELGLHAAFHDRAFDTYEALPSWARATLEKHGNDRRAYLYPLAALESSSTHDRVWNAAQAQLVGEGRVHNYLRMLWGKKILEWTRHPREALEVMVQLNDRYALDGRDPNSTSGIFWVMGRYDRAWGPERDVFGTVRYMSSANAVRKVRMARYLERWAP